jgi:hypothetical protein
VHENPTVARAEIDHWFSAVYRRQAKSSQRRATTKSSRPGGLLPDRPWSSDRRRAPICWTDLADDRNGNLRGPIQIRTGTVRSLDSAGPRTEPSIAASLSQLTGTRPALGIAATQLAANGQKKRDRTASQPYRDAATTAQVPAIPDRAHNLLPVSTIDDGRKPISSPSRVGERGNLE